LIEICQETASYRVLAIADSQGGEDLACPMIADGHFASDLCTDSDANDDRSFR
jgi:hypothetical protein